MKFNMIHKAIISIALVVITWSMIGIAIDALIYEQDQSVKAHSGYTE